MGGLGVPSRVASHSPSRSMSKRAVISSSRVDDQFASGSDNPAFAEFLDFHDPGLRLGIAVSRRHRDQNSRRGTLCQINYGGLLQLLK